ncbi:hypothetical protein I5U42_11550 [Stenotrophomonas maltophilia]|nr:hypothetical protein [Stenotrophomonas maltophilia]MDV9043710.1 hypothetical protein [Stenotrophomonas sp. RAC2]
MDIAGFKQQRSVTLPGGARQSGKHQRKRLAQQHDLQGLAYNVVLRWIARSALGELQQVGEALQLDLRRCLRTLREWLGAALPVPHAGRYAIYTGTGRQDDGEPILQLRMQCRQQRQYSSPLRVVPARKLTQGVVVRACLKQPAQMLFNAVHRAELQRPLQQAMQRAQ